MAIRTSIARHYAVRLIVMSIVMFVLGMWGVYDYLVGIPAHQRAFERYQVLSLTQAALRPDLRGEELTEATSAARTAIDHELNLVLDDHAKRTGIDRARMNEPEWRLLMVVQMGEPTPEMDAAKAHADYESTAKVVQSLRETDELEWVKGLLLFSQALAMPRTPSGDLTDQQRAVYGITEQQMNAIAKDEVPAKPSTFDHVVQLAYISLLLCVPYFLWVYVATVKRVYTLDEDGSLHSPEGSWPRDEIADIDMSRWMSKSLAYVVHKDGRRIMLDDYKHKDMFRIVGALAHRFYPDEWTEEAKPVKAEGDEGQGDADDAAQAEQDAVDAVFDGEEGA